MPDVYYRPILAPEMARQLLEPKALDLPPALRALPFRPEAHRQDDVPAPKPDSDSRDGRGGPGETRTGRRGHLRGPLVQAVRLSNHPLK